jgi:TonB family protein
MVRHSPGSSTAPTAPSTDIAQTQMERAASAASEGASPAPAASGGTAGEPLARLTMIRSAEGAAAQEGERGNPFAGDVVPFASPAPLRHAPPDYPSVAVSMRQTGSVRLLVKVESDGRVTEVRVTGHATPVLDQAAVNAAYGWSYKPAQQNGQPVATWVEETVEFRLR